jgi:hypothetical protein
MEVSKSAAPAARPVSVALDFLMLAGASVIAGLVTAAVAAALVILLTGQADAAADASQTSASSTETAPLHPPVD